jgi:hypothetical protein
MLGRNVIFLTVVIALRTYGSAADSWRAIHCDPQDTAEASGIRIMSEKGAELLRVCQDGALVSQTGFVSVTSDDRADFLLVTQVGAKLREATLYRKSGAQYVRVGWWSGWDIRAVRRHDRPAIHYEELQPTLDHPRSVVYFTWNGSRLVADRAAEVSFHE